MYARLKIFRIYLTASGLTIQCHRYYEFEDYGPCKTALGKREETKTQKRRAVLLLQAGIPFRLVLQMRIRNLSIVYAGEPLGHDL